MTGGTENPLQRATAAFDSAIYGIRDSQVQGLCDIGARSVDRIRNSELFIVANNSLFNIPSVTGFDLIQIPGSRTQFVPAIIMDIGKTLGSNEKTFQADLARTIAIADQYPFNGFQRRFHQVYGDALDAQKTWLESVDTPTLSFDPRVTDKKILLKYLMGDDKHYSDVGFDDWENAVGAFRQGNQSISELSLLKGIENDTGHFISMRQHFLPQFHKVGIQKGGEAYLTEWTQERRSEFIAAALVGSSLYAREPDNLS